MTRWRVQATEAVDYEMEVESLTQDGALAIAQKELFDDENVIEASISDGITIEKIGD